MADPEISRMLKLSRGLMIATFALYLPLFALMMKTLEEGQAFLDNSNRMVELVREYHEQRRKSPKPSDMALLGPETGQGAIHVSSER